MLQFHKCIKVEKLSSSYFRFRFITTKEKFHDFIDTESSKKKDDDGETAESTEETCAEEPESKKLKLNPEEKPKEDRPDCKRHRGQNKSRPHVKPNTYEEKRLCLSVVKVRRLNKQHCALCFEKGVANENFSFFHLEQCVSIWRQMPLFSRCG